MQMDLTQIDCPAGPVRSQVCIVGGGIAGLTLAQRLTELGVRVALLEAGGVAPDAAAVDRVLGGTSLRWGGQLLPLAADAPWAAGAAELGPFYRAAERLLAVDDLPYEAAAFFAASRAAVPGLLGRLPELEAVFSKWTPFSHRNLAGTLGRSLRASPLAAVYLHATATELLLAPGGGRVEAVLVRTPAGQGVRFEAAQVVVAAGTVETCRLLLGSRSVAAGGVGNQHGQVGRNFHDHLTLPAATLRGAARRAMLGAFRPWVLNGTVHSLKLEASPELRQRLGIHPVLAHVAFEDAEGSGTALVRRLLLARQQGGLAQTLLGSAGRLPGAAWSAWRLGYEARRHHRRHIPAETQVTLMLNAVQDAPSAARIRLSDQVDALGVPRAVVERCVSAAELRTLRGFAAHLRAWLEENGAGSGVAWQPGLFAEELPLAGLDDARHAMGGACMGSDPRSSVVDAELRVHGVDNLSVASAAVFPTGAAQLPTLPLMALTLRLAERLAARAVGQGSSGEGLDIGPSG
jgi:choline dehydrogenase-like flavoprotein